MHEGKNKITRDANTVTSKIYKTLSQSMTGNTTWCDMSVSYLYAG